MTFLRPKRQKNTDPRTNCAAKLCYCSWPPNVSYLGNEKHPFSILADFSHFFLQILAKETPEFFDKIKAGELPVKKGVFLGVCSNKLPKNLGVK